MKTVIAMIFGLLVAGAGQGGEFYAYHTSLEFDPPADTEVLSRIPGSAAEAFAGRPGGASETSFGEPPRPGPVRWGKFPDLVVHIAAGRELVFSRQSGHLPYLKTSHGRFPFQRLVESQADPLCLCSYVRLVENLPGRIVVHWRHVPDPARVVMTEVIHEYFTVTPDGKVRREVRVGTPSLDDFEDPGNVTVEESLLAEDGIARLSLRRPKRAGGPGPAVAGSPMRKNAVGSPAAWFRFDEGLGPNRDEAFEAVKTIACPVAGNKTLWKKGVSGSALAFDGYTSKVALPASRAPRVTEELTLEAWVVLGAYPWNDAGIVHCSSGEPVGPEDYKHGYRDPYTYRPWRMEGYMLGIDPYGRPIFKLNGNQVGGGVVQPEETVPRKDTLPRYRWVHLAGTYGAGKMSLYVDGQVVDSKPATGPVIIPARDLLIGLNGDPQRISDPVSHSKRAANNNLPLLYGIEGLIDEVRIFDRALSADEIRRSFESLHPGPETTGHPDLERRILPGEVTGSVAPRFGASCRTLKYHELWDNLWRGGKHRDIVVRFDEVPCSVVFWQGTNFGSGWVTENNKWMSDQSWEIGGPHGCAEHMADKRGRFGHVRLIENTGARVVVHWRYPSIDVGYVFPGVGVWVDEYYTIYPDGVGVRHVEGVGGGWHDTQFLSQPGTTCLDNVDLTALSVADLQGRSEDLTWELPNRVPANPLEDACIKLVRFKSDWKVFVVYREGVRIGQWGAGEQSKHTADPFAGPWNHWPVGLNPSDGRYAVSDDRVTHAAIGGARGVGNLVLYGFTKRAVSSLVPLAKSWNRPPALAGLQGARESTYEPTERAYRLSALAPTLSFTLRGSDHSPVHNPCFVIDHWNGPPEARVVINGTDLPAGKTCRQGIIRATDGSRSLVIWLELESTAPAEIRISGASAPLKEMEPEPVPDRAKRQGS